MKFPIKDFFNKFNQNLKFSADMIIFTEENLNGKPYFCAVKEKEIELHYSMLNLR